MTGNTHRSERDRQGNRCDRSVTLSLLWRRDPLKAQGGVYAIMFVMVLAVLLGMCGLALDLSRMYNRKAELQIIADATVLAAARELRGTKIGVTNAVSKASEAVARLKYQYYTQSIPWSGNALRFSASPTAPDSDWLDAEAAEASPEGLLFAKVDTFGLAAEVGQVEPVFMRMFSGAQDSKQLAARAVAGRVSINVTPLAVCALSAVPQAPLDHPAQPGPPVSPALQELVQYGFRRGIIYDLVQLPSNGTSTAHFVVDPVDPLGTRGAGPNVSAEFVAPFVCTGTMLANRLVDSEITVGGPFPIGSVFPHLNTRFGEYLGTSCSSLKSLSDSNIKPYKKSSTYNPLWSYAKAVPYSSYTSQGPTEPTAGYTPFPATTATWTTLYPAQGPYPGQSSVTAYPSSSTPYLNSTSPGPAPTKLNRRVLNVPLLQCPISASGTTTAKVLAIGKFFMTEQATSTSLKAEFAGLMQEQTFDGEVELFK